LILIARPAFERPETLHIEFVRDALQETSPYRLSQSDRIVTAAEMRGGRFAYVRSDRAGTADSAAPWMTYIIIANETNRGRLRLIASRFARSRMQSLDTAPTSVLAALLRDGSALPFPPSSFNRTPRLAFSIRGICVNAGLKLHQSPEQKCATFLDFAGPILRHLVEFRFVHSPARRSAPTERRSCAGLCSNR